MPAAEGPGNLYQDVGVGKVDGEVAYLGDHQIFLLALAEGGVEPFAFLVWGLAGNQRDFQLLGQLFQLVDVLPDDKHPVVGLVKVGEEPLYDIRLFGIGACESNLFTDRRQGVFHLQFRFHRDADFVTVGGGDPALGFQHTPGDVVFLGPDKAEHFRLLVVFADQGGGKAQAAGGLHFGTQAEHRGREQVHLVINHEAPFLFAEQREVREFLLDFFVAQVVRFGFALLVRVFHLLALGENLVGGHGHGADFLHFAGVFLHLVGGQVRLVADFADPLAGGGNVGRKDKGLGLHEGHGGKADDRLARTAGQHDNAGAALFRTAGVEHLGGFLLVVAELEFLAFEGGLPELDGERVALDISCQVFYREPGVGKCHLQVAPAFRVHFGVGIVQELPDKRFHFFQVANLGEHVGVVGFQQQAVNLFAEPQQAVPGHVVFHLGNHRLGNGVAALAFQPFKHFGCAEARGSRVPEAQVGNLVGVQVLGALDQFGEGSYRVPCGFVVGIVHLDHDFEVALYNDGAIRIHRAANIEK